MSDQRTPQGAAAPTATSQIDVTHTTELNLSLDEAKIQAIRGCIERGAAAGFKRLTSTIEGPR